MGNLYDSLSLDSYEEEEMYSNYLEDIIRDRELRLEAAKNKLELALKFISTQNLYTEWREFNKKERHSTK